MTPEQLLTFAYVADARNISRAAAHLNLSQPAVSGQLRALQEWFGEALYRRQGHGITLTSAGERLAEHARQVRQAYGQACALRDAWQGLTVGTLRLGASTTPASYLLPPLVAAFRQAYPGVSVHMSDGNTSQIVQRLPLLDLAFIEGEVPLALPPDTAVHGWREDEVVAIVGADHPLAARREVALTELAHLPLVMREPGSGVRALVEQAFAASSLAPEIGLELAGVEGVKQAVRAGLGVGFVSIMSMRHEDGSLAVLPVARPGLKRTVSILVPNAGAPARAAALFFDLCQPVGVPVGRRGGAARARRASGPNA